MEEEGKARETRGRKDRNWHRRLRLKQEFLGVRVETGEEKFELRGKSGTFTQDTEESQGRNSGQGDQGMPGKAFVTHELMDPRVNWKKQDRKGRRA